MGARDGDWNSSFFVVMFQWGSQGVCFWRARGLGGTFAKSFFDARETRALRINIINPLKIQNHERTD
jgi:hypothetical protein